MQEKQEGGMYISFFSLPASGTARLIFKFGFSFLSMGLHGLHADVVMHCHQKELDSPEIHTLLQCHTPAVQ